MNSAEILFSLLRFELCGKPLSDKVKDSLTNDKLEILLKSAKGHDIAHIAYSALIKNDLLSNENQFAKKFELEKLHAIYRYKTLEHELRQISELFEASSIPFIPLKGSVIRSYYPEPWMRTSCDIDILVKESDIERATNLIAEKMNYDTDGKRDFHDVSLHSPSGIHLELHFNILENMENIDRLLSQVWEHSAPIKNGNMEHRQSNEYLIFHVLAHMAYHFVFGGCGIRPLIDLYLLENKSEYDKEKLLLMCRECGIEKFYLYLKNLMAVWFEEAAGDDLTKEIEKYILLGGTYGDRQKGIAAKQAKSGGKISYAIGRIFQPYNVIKEKYPILKKHPYLTPAYEVKRWFDLLMRGKIKGSVNELRTNNSVSKEESQNAAAFLSKLGL